jgi:hypothetical protein
MSRTFNLYLGKGGQLAAMSFFLMRGWNVATPEVDIGDDIFVVDDKKGFFSRIQVKTSNAVERGNGYSVQFNLPLDQVATSTDPEIYYVFIVCRNGEWSDKLVIPRQALDDFHIIHKIGSVYKKTNSLMLYFAFQDGKVMCSGQDFTEFRNNFSDFPLIPH